MGERTVLGRLSDGQGNITVVFDDGSTATMNAYGQITAQDPSPNPSRAAMMRSGDEAGAQRTVEAASIENARRFDADIQVKQDTLKNNYQVALMNARTDQEKNQITQQYNQAQVDMAKQKFAFDQQTSARDFGQRQLEFNTNTDIQRAQIGNTLVGTLANMRGPANFYQASEYARGISALPQTSTFLSSLQNNTRLPGYGAQGGLPTPESYGTLAAKLGGDASGGVGAPSNDNTLAQIGNIAAKGAHQLAPGSLEHLTPTEMGLFTSGLDRLGVDKDTFLDQYRRSRVGQGIAGSRAA